MTYVKAVSGRVNPVEVIKSVRDSTCLVTCILANNETGVIQVLKIVDEFSLNFSRFELFFTAGY